MADEYYSLGPSLRGYDFYTGDEAILAAADLSLAIDLTSNSYKISVASSSLSIGVFTLSVGQEIQRASTNINITSNVSVLTQKSAFADSISDIDITSVFTAIKIAKASAEVNVSSSLNCSTQKDTFGSSIMSSSVDSSFNTIKIAFSDPDTQEINSDCVVIAKEILLVGSLMNVLLSSTVNPPLRYSPSFVDSSSIITLMVLDNKPLTNHGRRFDSSLSPIFIENINWNNRKSRYYKRAGNGSKKTFNINWTYLPNFKEKTVDNRHARDFISSIAQDPDSHVLEIINQDTSGLTPETKTSHIVFVRSYSETLVRRDLQDNVYYFDCSLTLEEA